MITKDNKAMFDTFLRHIFVFCQEIRENGIPEIGCLPFRVAEPQDMKISQISQICMGRGGAAKQIPHFCHLCQKHSDNLARPTQVKCHKCCSNGNHNCFCYPIADAKKIASVRLLKAAIDAKEEPKRLTFLCEQLYGGGELIPILQSMRLIFGVKRRQGFCPACSQESRQGVVLSVLGQCCQDTVNAGHYLRYQHIPHKQTKIDC
jgi:hypothetical protein